MKRAAALAMIGIGLLLIAGAVYPFTGLAMVALGLLLSGYDRAATGAVSAIVAAVVAIAGGLGALMLFAQFFIQRFTALT